MNRWLPELLGWIIPLLFLVGILGLLLPPHVGRRGRRHVVRAQQGEDLRRRRSEGAVPGRGPASRKRRTSSRRSSSSCRTRRSTPTWAAGFPRACCWSARRAPARRCSRARSPARRTCRFFDERLGVRRDVRRRRRRPHPRSVSAGRSQGAVHRLHRRARRAGQGAHAEPVRQPRGARADPEPAARRDGRLRLAQRRHHHGRHQPAGSAGSGAAAPRPLRSAGCWSTSPTSRGARRSCASTSRASRSVPTSTSR